MSHTLSLRISRMIDILAAGSALLMLSPLLVLISLTILIESGRPIFFTQTRLGTRGSHFRMHKFRKFHSAAGTKGSPLTMKYDPRLTRIGRLLAQTKLDELPQLYNILIGDMSIVGPRPESLDLADCFTEANRRVLDYRPGIFGPSQVAFKDECSFFPPNSDVRQFYRDILFPLKAAADLTYYPTRTLFSDLGWIARGVLAVVRGGARMAAEPHHGISRQREQAELGIGSELRKAVTSAASPGLMNYPGIGSASS